MNRIKLILTKKKINLELKTYGFTPLQTNKYFGEIALTEFDRDRFNLLGIFHPFESHVLELREGTEEFIYYLRLLSKNDYSKVYSEVLESKLGVKDQFYRYK